MTWIIRCPCGHVVRGATQDEVVANADQHAREAHQLDPTREELLAMAVPEEASPSGT